MICAPFASVEYFVGRWYKIYEIYLKRISYILQKPYLTAFSITV
jgi:hypothetical protein